MLMAFASIGLTLWVTWQLEGGAAAVNEAGRMRMQTWRMAQTLARADAQQIAGLAAQFDQSVNVLRTDARKELNTLLVSSSVMARPCECERHNMFSAGGSTRSAVTSACACTIGSASPR